MKMVENLRKWLKINKRCLNLRKKYLKLFEVLLEKLIKMKRKDEELQSTMKT